MKSLKLNPQDFEIDLSADISETENGYATVFYNLLGTEGEINMTSKEAEKVGNWFLKLSKEIKEKN